MKKWMVIILLFITAAGMFIPCCQIDDCPAEQLTSSSQNNDQKQEGACSPFFSCATCPGFAELSKPFKLAQLIVELQEHYSDIVSLTLSAYSAKQFQPPRIA